MSGVVRVFALPILRVGGAGRGRPSPSIMSRGQKPNDLSGFGQGMLTLILSVPWLGASRVEPPDLASGRKVLQPLGLQPTLQSQVS